MNPLLQELQGISSESVYAIREVKPLHRGSGQCIQVFICSSSFSSSPPQSPWHRWLLALLALSTQSLPISAKGLRKTVLNWKMICLWPRARHFQSR